MNSIRNLHQWLEYLEQCHPSNIELGLERINLVAAKLPIDFSGSKIITVGGTNGKGSTVAMLSAILEQGGFETASYTSPHLMHYNERVKLGSRLATDAELCESFANVEAARGDIPLTYFEFGTLAALQLFSEKQPDYVLLEVGLGGRLDAVNILDPDLAIVTNIALDHMDWLGETRELIGFEKAGIFRPQKPALIGEREIPQSVLDHAESIGAHVFRNGEHFSAGEITAETWEWRGKDKTGLDKALELLPQNNFPLDNCASVVQAISLLAPGISIDQIKQGLQHAVLEGRFQHINRGYPLILDVAHNPHAVKRLIKQIHSKFPESEIHLIIAMLADKNYREVLELFSEIKPFWYVAGIQEDRGLEAKILYNYLSESGDVQGSCFTTVSEAFNAAEKAVKERQIAKGNAVILVTGSFFTVSAVLEML